MSGFQDLKERAEADLTHHTYHLVTLLRKEDVSAETCQVLPVEVQQPLVRKEKIPSEQQERSLNQKMSEPLHIKEEPEEPWSQEGEQLQGPEEADIIKFTFDPDSVKSEDDEEEHQSSQLHHKGCQQIKTGTDTEDCEGAEAAWLFDAERGEQPENMVVKDEYSSGAETDDSTDWRQSEEHQSDLSSTERPKSEKKSHICFECGKMFTRRHWLNNHMRTHTGEKPFSCSLCGKTFSRKSYLSDHMRVHSGDKPFCCSLCGKQFNQKKNLNAHMRVHTKEKPFSCSVCDKRFNRISHLTNHVRIHTGEKPFSCSVCGKCFNRKGFLKDHMRVHSGEKPYSCSWCDKRFNQKSSLTTHERIHTGEKPFSCSECGKGFYLKGHLTRHMHVHTEMKPRGCPECCRSPEQLCLTHQLARHRGKKPLCRDICDKTFSPNNQFERPIHDGGQASKHQNQGAHVKEVEIGGDGSDCEGSAPVRISDSERHFQPETEVMTEDFSEPGGSILC